MGVFTTPTLIDESTFVMQLKSHQQDAYKSLFSRYGAALLGTIYRYVKDRDTADDLLQDCWVLIWRHISSYDQDKGRLFTWMNKLTHNRCLDHLKSKQNRMDSYTDDINDLNTTQVDQLSWQPTTTLFDIKKLIGNLNPEQKLLIDLCYFKDMPYKDVAKRMDMPLGTLKTKLRRTIQELRHIYGNDFPRLLSA